MRLFLLGLLGCLLMRADLLTMTASGANGGIQSSGSLAFLVPTFDQALGTLNSVHVDWSATIKEGELYYDVFSPTQTYTLTETFSGSFAGVSDTAATLSVNPFQPNDNAAQGYGGSCVVGWQCIAPYLTESLSASGQVTDITPFLGSENDISPVLGGGEYVYLGAFLTGTVSDQTPGEELAKNESGPAYLLSITANITYDYLGLPRVSATEAVRIVRSALDQGVNFLDNSWDYNDGESEIRVGKALRDGYRQRAFVMTKIDGRTKESATRQIDESLHRLQTGHIDLLQHHEVIRFEDPDRIFAADGAMEAFLNAKKAGKIRFIGFTGHKDPHVHLYMLEVARQHGFHFDTVQMPLNVMDAHFRSFGKLVLPEAVRQNIGVLGMKSMGDSVILKSNTVSAKECLHYAMHLPVSVVITGVDSVEILQQALAAARTVHTISERDILAITGKTAKAAAQGTFELFKTTSHFDSTAKHPEWLGGETEPVQKLAEGTG